MDKSRFEITVGFFVVVGFLILSLMVFFISGIYIFRPGYHLTATFDYVGIINQGAPVRFAGVRVGEVSKVEILKPKDEKAKTRIQIQFFLEKNVEVREHYEVSVQGTHIMSEPHIAINPVYEGGRILKDGDVIEGISPSTMDDLIKRGESIAMRIDNLLEGVQDLFDTETKKSLRESIQNMNHLLKFMNAATEGQEGETREMIVHLNQVAEEMSTLLKKTNAGEGTLGKLLTQDEIYNDLRDFTRDIKARPWRLFKKG